MVRIFNTYGPNMALDDGRVVSNFVAQVRTCCPLFSLLYLLVSISCVSPLPPWTPSDSSSDARTLSSEMYGLWTLWELLTFPDHGCRH